MIAAETAVKDRYRTLVTTKQILTAELMFTQMKQREDVAQYERKISHWKMMTELARGESGVLREQNQRLAEDLVATKTD